MKKIITLLVSGLIAGSNIAQTPDYTVSAPYTSPTRNTCGAVNNCTTYSSEDHIYQVTIPSNAVWTFSLCGGASWDTRLLVGTFVCGTDIAMNDDYCDLQSEITATITSGTYYVTVEGYGSTDCGNYILDISGPVSNDVGVIAINAPVSSCGLTSTESVTISVKNFGTNAQSNIPVAFNINGGGAITGSIPGPLSAGDTAIYTFTATVNLSTPGIYVFDAWTSLMGDANTLNNSLTNYKISTDQFVENVCIIDFIDTGAFNYNCNFTNNLCVDGYDYGNVSLQTSPPVIINASAIDSITFYLYYAECGFGTNFILYLNGTQIGTFTDMLGDCNCNPSTYPYIYTVTDSAILNAAWSDTNTLGVIHNGTSMAVAGYSASIYAQCTPSTFINTSNDTTICIGDSVNLTVTITDSVGFPAPYTFLWSPSVGLSCSACQSPVANPASTTTYMVMVTDSTGAQDSAFVTVTVFSSLPVANAGTDTVICEKETAQLNATGGVYYSWSPSTALSDTGIANPVANPVIITEYMVTVYNGCGSDVDTVTVFVNPLPLADAGSDTSVCIGDSIQLNATGGISYLWTPGISLSDSAIANPYASPLSTTTYTVKVTDVNGCVNTGSLIVSVGGGSIIAAATRDSICAGDTTQLFAYSCAPPLFYDGFEDGTYNKWTDAGGGYTITPTTSTAAVGNYSLQLTGGNWSFFDGVYTTFSPSAPDEVSFYFRTSLPSFWNGGYVAIGDDNTQTNGGIISLYSDVSGFFYMNGISSAFIANQWYHIECNNIDFTGKTLDYYVDGVLIQSNVAFNASASTYISQIHLFNVEPGITTYYDEILIGAPCSGIDTTLSYSWAPSTGLSNPNIASPVASPATTTSYIVTASGGGCSSTDTVTVYTAALDVSADAGTSFICSGDAAQLNATANIGGVSFSWSPAGGLSCTNCPAPLASPTSTTMYYVTGTSGSCTDVDSVLITVGTGPVPPSCTPLTTNYCCGNGIYNVTFNAINNTTPDGIEGYQDYSCSKATSVIIDLSYPVSIQTSASDAENVRVWIDYNNNGIFANDTTTELVFWSNNILTNHSGVITIPLSAVINTPLRMRVGSDVWWNTPPAPCTNVIRGQFEDYTVIILPNTIPPVADFALTILDTCQGIVSFTDQSLYDPTSWFWNFGDGSGVSASQNPYYSYDIPGTYAVTLIVTNPYGTDTTTQQVVISSLTANFTVSSNTVGIGEFAYFYDNSTGSDTWLWNFGDGFSATLQNPIHSYFTAGTYNVTLTVSNASGCIAQMMQQIMVCSSIPQTGAIIGPVNVSVAGTTNYSVPFNNGSIYNWTVIGGNQTSGGQTNFIAVQWTTSGIGKIIVIETDNLGCSGDTASLFVNVGGVGMGEIGWNDLLKVYPNPGRGKFQLSVIGNQYSVNKITVYNILGKEVYRSPNTEYRIPFTIDLTAQPAGVYHLQIITDRGIAHKKVVIE